MANNALTPIMITKEQMRVMENNLVIAKHVNRSYSDQFAVSGAKIGATLNVRIPPQYEISFGPALQVQDAIETFRPITMTTQAHVDISFTTADLTLDIDDFSERFVRPAMPKIANEIDTSLAAMMKNNTWNQVGTPGVIPNSGLTYLQAGVRLQNQSVPMGDDIAAVISPMGQAVLVDAQKGLFQQSDLIANQYRNGNMGRAFGMKFSMDQNVPLQINGPFGGVPVTTGAQFADPLPQGVTGNPAANLLTPFPLVTGGWTAAAAPRVNAGDTFVLAGVFEVNPVSKQPTGSLQQFVCVAGASSTAAGAATLEILPRPIFTGPFQNVTSATNNVPASTPLTFIGVANQQMRQDLVFHKDAYMMASADLMMPDGVDFKARTNYKGISMRTVRQYRIGSDDLPCRTDVLYGVAPLYPQWGSRVTE